jgi:hypothetical protein
LSETAQDLSMITIRTAKPSDIAQLVELLKELFTIEADFDFDQEKQACGLNLLLNSEKDCILVAELLCDNRVLGIYVYGTNPDFISERRSGRIA